MWNVLFTCKTKEKRKSLKLKSLSGHLKCVCVCKWLIYELKGAINAIENHFSRNIQEWVKMSPSHTDTIKIWIFDSPSSYLKINVQFQFIAINVVPSQPFVIVHQIVRVYSSGKNQSIYDTSKLSTVLWLYPFIVTDMRMGSLHIRPTP